MEVNAKVKELEEELKLLKAEIRNVLLDIREVILDRSNPLGEEHESAFIRMDLNTTARAMAAEAAAHEAAKFADQAQASAEPEEPIELADEPDHGATAGPPSEAGETGVEGATAAAIDVDDGGLAAGLDPLEGDAGPGEAVADEPPPKVIRRDPRQAPSFEPEATVMETTEIPQMYMASLPPLSGNGSLSAWVTEAMDAIGPENLERVIAMHRLWGALPPNISRALAYLQELLQTSQDARPPWLKVMQDLDRLASL